MDIYTFSFVLGGVGLVGMAVAGAMHSGGHNSGHGGGHGHGGHGHDTLLGHTPALTHNLTHSLTPGPGGHHGVSTDVHVGHHGALTGHHHIAGQESGPLAGLKASLLPLMSPRVLFSALLGFGATGALLRPFLGGAFLVVGALVGALVFELLFIAPMWRFLLRFASNPAQTFDAASLSDAQATSGFDANGEGLVAVEVDGQIIQCLGRLRETDRQLGIRVRAGDRLRVEDVDAARQRCTVSYVGHADATE